MRRGDNDGDARFTDLHRAKSVDHSNPADRILACKLAPDSRDNADRHRFVAFVFQPKGRTATCIVTDYALEGYTRAVTSLKQSGFEASQVDWLPGESEVVPFRVLNFQHRHSTGRAPADRRQQRHFIALGERLTGRSKFVVAGDYNAGCHGPQFRKLGRIILEYGAGRRAFGQLQLGLGSPADVLQKPEKQNSDVH